MKHILLLGAGFSRNWDGWLSNELIGDLLTRISDDKELASFLQKAKNFEEVLLFSKGNAVCGWTPDRYQKYMDAIKASFNAMNSSYLQRNFEFCNNINRSINRFLGKFDVIFTLNQDLLLEMNYNVSELPNISPTFPGIRPPPNWRIGSREQSQLDDVWILSNDFSYPVNSQPIFKLHGSVNWLNDDDKELLVMGNNKIEDIEQSPLLTHYTKEFRMILSQEDVRLMVIGYSFQDLHINQIITDAWKKNKFSMYLVDPLGAKLFKDPAIANNHREIMECIQLLGISTRLLSDTFGKDQLEYEKLLRFFKKGI